MLIPLSSYHQRAASAETTSLPFTQTGLWHANTHVASSSHKHLFFSRRVLVKISSVWVIPWPSAICWKACWQSERKVHILHSGANWVLVNKDNLWGLKPIRTVSVGFVDRTWFIGPVYFWLTRWAQIYWGLMTKMPNTPVFMRNQWGLLTWLN